MKVWLRTLAWSPALAWLRAWLRASVKVKVAVAVSVRKVAVTTHVPTAVAVSDLLDTVHPLLVVE